MQKYIHFCWFGDKPLPKLGKKCLKSWKKYLPDYEVMEWSEKNVDLEECPFIKEAYAKKKWAFVADYARAKAMYEYGGIYFDTDMLIVKDLDFLKEKESFLGVEDSNMIAAGIWGEKRPKNYLATKLLEYYRAQDGFDENDMYAFSIPKLITSFLRPFNYNPLKTELQVLDNGFCIYPREYFYPLSYNHQNNVFTKNTCAIHYYDASWVSKWEQRENKIFRTFGQERGQKVINLTRFGKRNVKRILKIPVYPYVLYRRKKQATEYHTTKMEEFSENLKKVEKNDYVIIHNPKFLGITSATKENFDSTLAISEVYNENNIQKFARELVDCEYKLIAFSGFCEGWDTLIHEIRKLDKNVTIKIIWHGGNAPLVEDYEWKPFKKVMELLRSETIDTIAFVKKSLYEFYKRKGDHVEFLLNNTTIDAKMYLPINPKKKELTKIGLYASGDRWIKNFYNQLAAASLVPNVAVECIPVSNKMMEFARMQGITIDGATKPVSHDKLLKMMALNDVNVYTTFSECSPMIPLESLELGVPCITSNNHHYFEGTPLEKYLVVNKNDDPIAIYEHIEICLKNREEIIKLYKTWKKEYDREWKKNVKKFLSIKE